MAGSAGPLVVMSVFLQTVCGYSAIQTGLVLTPATIGVLVSSVAAGRLARRYSQARLIQAGFVTTIVGVALLLLLVPGTSNVLPIVPGLLVVGLGVGVMLTSSMSCNPAFQRQTTERSRVCRGASRTWGRRWAWRSLAPSSSRTWSAGTRAMRSLVLIVFGLVALVAALMLPATPPEAPAPATHPAA